jgi:hypothetical protein
VSTPKRTMRKIFQGMDVLRDISFAIYWQKMKFSVLEGIFMRRSKLRERGDRGGESSGRSVALAAVRGLGICKGD